ncbi:PepSY domain-containing protein [Stackebrandtia nassauensis]|uniref:Propeptide PepSY amd peptidase M4 n=1 Tax=Stackebrandtia nassauensis (strain DSM 44728 / CIP 108903 / NRRL B-16338 / NBRC 102104 / LLR-40K-21) TaxID=446470 RepID=D3Q0R1_STANL|nr:PepSY domain-containing protein [Stackebrandtia nassauensis]ADD41797.1 Propeptide PepSY amd peptidase M4 [Stackebrandtia nassauensis DSM 44728]
MSEKLLNRRNRWIIAGATGVLLVGGSAALATTAFADDGDANETGAQVADDDDNDGDDDGTDDDGDDATPSTKPKISLADATATASDEVSKGILTSIELEGTNDAPFWRVDFITSDGTEHEVTIDAAKGDVTDHNKETDDDGDKEDWTEAKAANDQVKTTPEDAATAALDKAGKGNVTSIELDDDANNPQWEVDVTTDDGKHKDVTVDAVTGKATDVYTDDDDNDSDDANDDDSDQDDDNDQGDDDANDNDGDND